MQFGRALQQVVSKIVHADPRYGPPKLAKIDIADGFYRLWLYARDIPKLGVLLPATPDGPTLLVAFPLVLPMGWVESPPYFTLLTEAASDLTNQPIQCPEVLSVHPLESTSQTPPVMDLLANHCPHSWTQTPHPTNPIPLLLLFAKCYCSGVLAPGNRPVCSQTVEDALQSAGQAYTSTPGRAQIPLLLSKANRSCSTVFRLILIVVYHLVASSFKSSSCC